MQLDPVGRGAIAIRYGLLIRRHELVDDNVRSEQVPWFERFEASLQS